MEYNGFFKDKDTIVNYTVAEEETAETSFEIKIISFFSEGGEKIAFYRYCTDKIKITTISPTDAFNMFQISERL